MNSLILVVSFRHLYSLQMNLVAFPSLHLVYLASMQTLGSKSLTSNHFDETSTSFGPTKCSSIELPQPEHMAVQLILRHHPGEGNLAGD